MCKKIISFLMKFIEINISQKLFKILILFSILTNPIPSKLNIIIPNIVGNSDNLAYEYLRFSTDRSEEL